MHTGKVGGSMVKALGTIKFAITQGKSSLSFK